MKDNKTNWSNGVKILCYIISRLIRLLFKVIICCKLKRRIHLFFDLYNTQLGKYFFKSHNYQLDNVYNLLSGMGKIRYYIARKWAIFLLHNLHVYLSFEINMRQLKLRF